MNIMIFSMHEMSRGKILSKCATLTLFAAFLGYLSTHQCFRYNTELAHNTLFCPKYRKVYTLGRFIIIWFACIMWY